MAISDIFAKVKGFIANPRTRPPDKRMKGQATANSGVADWNSVVPKKIDLYLNSRYNQLIYPNQHYNNGFFGFNISEWIAEKFSSKLYGKGVDIEPADENNTKLKSLIDRLSFGGSLYDFMIKLEHLVSVRGGAVILFDQTEGNGVRWTVMDPPSSYSNRTIEQNAVYVKSTITYSQELIQYITWTAGEMRRTTLFNGVQMTPKVRRAVEETYNIKTEPDQVIKYDYNQIPVFIFFNKPKLKLFGNTLTQFTPDLCYVAGLQAQMDELMQLIMHELYMNRSRALLSLPKEVKQQIDKNPNDMYALASSGVQAVVEAQRQVSGDTRSNNWINVTLAQPNFTPYYDTFNNILDAALRGVHLSTTSTDQAQVTSALEVEMTQADDNQTIALRLNNRLNQLKRMVAQSLLIMDGTLGTIEEVAELIDITIDGNLGVTVAKKTEEATAMMAAGLMGKVEARQWILGESEEAARKAVDEATNEREAEIQAGLVPLNEQNAATVAPAAQKAADSNNSSSGDD